MEDMTDNTIIYDIIVGIICYKDIKVLLIFGTKFNDIKSFEFRIKLASKYMSTLNEDCCINFIEELYNVPYYTLNDIDSLNYDPNYNKFLIVILDFYFKVYYLYKNKDSVGDTTLERKLDIIDFILSHCEYIEDKKSREELEDLEYEQLIKIAEDEFVKAQIECKIIQNLLLNQIRLIKQSGYREYEENKKKTEIER